MRARLRIRVVRLASLGHRSLRFSDVHGEILRQAHIGAHRTSQRIRLAAKDLAVATNPWCGLPCRYLARSWPTPGGHKPMTGGTVMNAAFGQAVLRQAEAVAEETTPTETDIDVVCGNQGPLCEALYEWTDNELLAEGVSFILGTPIKMVIIATLALFLNRFAQRAIRRLTDRLGTATADHGDAVVTQRSVQRAEEREIGRAHV